MLSTVMPDWHSISDLKKYFFLTWPTWEDFIESVTTLLLLFMFFFFGHEAYGILSL